MALFSPIPDRSQLKRSAFSSPTRITLTTLDLTPTDSGYGSAFGSPDRWEVKSPQWDSPDWERSLFEHLDGNRSPDHSSSFDNSATETTFHTPDIKEIRPKRPRSASATLLQGHTARSRPSLPAHFFSESNLRATDSSPGTPPKKRQRSSSLRTPDRFIPLRDNSTPVSDVYRITKGVSQLSTSEKLIRNNSAASDAFVYRRRLVSPMASEYRLLSRSDTGAVRSRGLSTPSIPCS
jgi:hypothetical protein